MHAPLRSLSVALLALSCASFASAQTSSRTFTANLSLGSKGAQVTALQQALNSDPDTRIASSGPGSPGQETDYFGSLTRAAVIRFQEKYASDILTPAGLTQGNGYVRANTRAKLNTLSVTTANTHSQVISAATTTTATATSSSAAYLVKEGEKINIFTGDKIIANAQNQLYVAVNALIASRAVSHSTAPVTLPVISAAAYPSVTVGTPTPHSGAPGMYVSVKGTGLATNSVVYFGSTYIVRTVSTSSSGSLLFVIPPIPPGRYDIAVKTGGVVSNTTPFVITDPKNPLVHLQSVSPTAITYGGTLTITGSGFSPSNNTVVTTYQTFTNVSSADGTTLTVQVAPVSLQGTAQVSGGKITKPMSVYVVSDYGFSDTAKSFTMTL